MIHIRDLHFQYKSKVALKGLSLEVGEGEIFGFLGPNGSGKTTLFRILSTVLKPGSGEVRLDGTSIRQLREIRRKIGVVFQSSSLDQKLTVRENLFHQGHLYGLYGKELARRADEVSETLGISDRSRERVETLSGGLKRRVELAKGLLHRPRILLLDEPSTGLDPGARIDLWNFLRVLRDQRAVTILLTTHLMEEADQCNRIAIMNQGKIVASGEPAALRQDVGKDVLEIKASETTQLVEKIKTRFSLQPIIANGTIQLEHVDGAQFVTRLAESFPGELESITFRKPTLEDVFVHHTGHHFKSDES